MSRDVLYFRIEYLADHYGASYVARAVNMALFAKGETIDDAVRNLRSAIELYYASNGQSSVPRLMDYDLENSYT